jgi:hypothetical protein
LKVRTWERIGLREDIPGLKNMYRIVAVFLCTLKGWPVRRIRFAMIRVGSGSRKLPVATRWGAGSEARRWYPLMHEEARTRTLGILGLPQEHTRLLAVHHRTKCAGHVRITVPEIPLELVEVVRALASSARVLAVHWPYPESTRADAEHQGILRAHGPVVFSVPLHGEVEHRLLVLVREETKEHKRRGRGGC